jgi:Ca2+:H+ antiporter
MYRFTARERTLILSATAATIVAGLLVAMHVPPVLSFFLSGVALAVLAAVVGMATEQLGERLGPAATGIMQGAVANLPELFVGIFSLRAGLVTVVQSALVGSILANNLLVLGIALFAGGVKNGVQHFSKDQPRMIATLMLLSVAAIIVPTLSAALHTPASRHIDAMTVAVCLLLVAVFGASVVCSLTNGPDVIPDEPEPESQQAAIWPVWLSAATLVVAGIGSAFVSDWFVNSMLPAIAVLHISQAFTGLVIVAIAGNAVENVVGVQFAIKNQMDYAVSVILNSALQIALCLVPLLALLSFVIGPKHLTLVMPPMLVASLFLCTLVSRIVVFDGESNWLEGATLVGLYLIIVIAFWWG